MSKEYLEVFNNFIEMQDFITTIQKQQDEFVLGELNAKVNMVMGVDIEPKRLEKWVRQAMFIEKFTVNQLQDFAVGKMVRNLLKDKDNRIKNLEYQLSLTEKSLELAVKDKCKFENALLSTSLGIAGGKVAVPKKEKWYLEKAKEMMKSE